MNKSKKDKKEIEKYNEYIEKYSCVIVTYKDGEKQKFTIANWIIFEDSVTKIATKIKLVKRSKIKEFFKRLL